MKQTQVYKCDSCGRQGIAKYDFYEEAPLPPGWQQSVITVQRGEYDQETHVEYWCRQCSPGGVTAGA